MEFRWRKICTFGGSIVAYLIGSGFASGQEALQFVSAFGLQGGIGVLLLTTTLYFFFCSVVMADGQRLQFSSPNKIFTYYCPRRLGLFFEFYTPLFLFLVYIIMLAGAGAIVEEHTGMPALAGRIGMALLSIGTVLLGLDGLVGIVSKVGPLIILFVVAVGVAGMIMNPGGLWEANRIIAEAAITRAAPNWLVSGLIFPAMGCVMSVPFLTSLGKTASTPKEARLGGIAGAATFSLAVSVLALGLLTEIGELHGKSIPALHIAVRIFPGIGTAFTCILLAGVFTTAVPMLWLSCNRIAPDETSRPFRIAAVVLTCIAFVASRFSFVALVNIVYPVTGYLGIVLMVCIAMRHFKPEKDSP